LLKINSLQCQIDDIIREIQKPINWKCFIITTKTILLLLELLSLPLSIDLNLRTYKTKNLHEILSLHLWHEPHVLLDILPCFCEQPLLPLSLLIFSLSLFIKEFLAVHLVEILATDCTAFLENAANMTFVMMFLWTFKNNNIPQYVTYNLSIDLLKVLLIFLIIHATSLTPHIISELIKW